MNALAKPRKPVVCDEYRLWVKSLPSVESGLRPCEAHHRIGDRYGQSKTDDTECIPLLASEHSKLHSRGWPEWESRCGTQQHHVSVIQDLARSKGLIERNPDGSFSFNRKALKRAVEYS